MAQQERFCDFVLCVSDRDAIPQLVVRLKACEEFRSLFDEIQSNTEFKDSIEKSSRNNSKRCFRLNF